MKKGDFVEIDFVGRIASTGEVFDLTSEEDAKKEGLYDPKHKYKPSLVIVGSGMAVEGVDKEIERMEVGEEREFEVKPEEGFGERTLNLVKVVPLSIFKKEKINPVPGIYVDIDGFQAKVLSVSGGRVRVDFNHPLAGKALKYKVRIVRQITDTHEKAKSLLSYYGIRCETGLEGDKLVIKTEKPIPDFLKDSLGKKIMEWIPEIKNILFGETEKKEIAEQKKAQTE
ncbi:MAG: peptidylprolyl isomerase [Candidatus Aenigmatarchaeota archaeon]